MSVPVSSDYGYVIISAGFISFVQFFLGGLAGIERKCFKSKDFLEQNEVVELQQQHLAATDGIPMNSQGYPDMGNGRYSALLSYAQWLNFNNAQRGHYNMIESSAPVLATMMGVGFIRPKAAGALGFVYGIGRIVYGLGYASRYGADGRLVGAIISEFSLFGLMGLSFYDGARVVGLLPMLKRK